MRYRRSIAVVLYFVVQFMWIVAVDQSATYGSDPVTAVVLTIIGLANVGLGVATGWWPAPVLPVLTVIMAMPLGIPNGDYHEPFPVWFGVLLLLPVQAVLVALGVAARRLWDWYGKPTEAR